MQYDLEYVLDSALDGVFIVASDHRLVLFNRACEELYNISREDVVDKACWKLSDFQQTLNGISKKGGTISYGELGAKTERMVLNHKEGRQVWVETIYTPIFDKDTGEIAYVMGVIKDITELKQVEDEKERLQKELVTIRRELESKYDFSSIVGNSPEIIKALKLASQVAPQNTTVMLVGESGTGKELLAKAIHYNSQRASRPFVALNCSAFPDTLFESELFGYEKGAFTGADKAKPGKIALASDGTLFLDEVTSMSAPTQSKILRVIQEREYEPLGAVRSKIADIRIIAATNKDLESLVREGSFREDLYYRLFVYPITLPPLRERIGDLPALIETLLKKFHHAMGKKVEKISSQAMELLTEYHWPGNVRELQNVMERLVILSDGDRIDVSDLPGYLVESARTRTVPWKTTGNLAGRISLEDSVHQVERDLILKALQKCGNNKTRAAHLLGLTRSTFRYKLSKISPDISPRAKAKRELA
ncbi:MAG: sigma 54-interacting transcriptional regulator [Nitrospinota bacterium]|nr:sigma 54-interacting transcriptional regulator [Nitrospinota bacterium]